MEGPLVESGFVYPGGVTLDQIAPAAGTVNFGGFRATLLADPTAQQDAATKQFVENRAGPYILCPGSYAAPTHTGSWNTSSAMTNANDSRYLRVAMPKTGTLHDLYALINTTGGNGHVGVLDDGQANGTHTTRTCLADSGSIAVPANGSWIGFDPALAVVAGDTLCFVLTLDGITAKAQIMSTGLAGASNLPNTSFFPASGAGATSRKVAGSILAANYTPGVGNTVLDSNMPSGGSIQGFVFRIT